MCIDELGNFIETTQTRSITKTLKNTYISLQGLSSALQKEKELENKLFERNPNRVTLNDVDTINRKNIHRR